MAFLQAGSARLQTAASIWNSSSLANGDGQTLHNSQVYAVDQVQIAFGNGEVGSRTSESRSRVVDQPVIPWVWCESTPGI